MNNLAARNHYILVCSFFGYLLGGKYKKKAEAQMHVYQGERCYQKRKWEMAWKKFIMAENLNPKDEKIIYYLTNIYFNLKRYDYSLDYILKFKALPKSKIKDDFKLEMDLLYANIKILLGRNEESIEVFKELIEVHEKKREVNKDSLKPHESDQIDRIRYLSNKNVARVLFNDRKFDEAADYYSKALEIDDNSEIHYDMGLMKFMKGEYEKASEEFSTAIEDGFSSEEAYFRRAFSYFKMKEYKKAREDFKTVIIEFPEGNYLNSASSFLDTIKYF